MEKEGYWMKRGWSVHDGQDLIVLVDAALHYADIIACCAARGCAPGKSYLSFHIPTASAAGVV